MIPLATIFLLPGLLGVFPLVPITYPKNPGISGPESKWTYRLLRDLSHQDPKVRKTALESLGPSADMPVLEAVTNALSDPNEGVRWRAIDD